MSLVDTNWLEKNINNVKIIDCSWHMPQTNRNGFEEYLNEHIPNAIFFDLDKNSKTNTDLPHMLTDLNSWKKIMGDMGIEKKDEVVIYDNSDVISSCRCWYNLIYFGHDPKLVHILDGGFKKWKNINKNDFMVIDARSKERFDCKVAEPRKGLRSGSIKNSLCLPFKELINDDHTFVSKDVITKKFKSLNFYPSKNLVFSCGSGVTASVLALAYSLINDKYMPTIYDGSWSEYGKN